MSFLAFLNISSLSNGIVSYLTTGTFILSIVIIILINLRHSIQPYLRSVKLALSLPGPPAYPIIGNALLATDTNLINTMGRTARDDYGTVFRTWISLIPMIVITEPEHIQKVLASSKHTEKMFLYRLLHNFLGEGLVTSTGNKWKVNRKIIQPMFTLNVLETFIDTFSDSAQSLVTKLAPYSNGSHDLNITSYVNACVFDILNESVLGVPINNNGATDNKIGKSPFREGKVVAPYRIGHPWLLLNWVYRLTSAAKHELQQKQNLHTFTKKIIEHNLNEQENNKFNERRSFLQRFLDVSDANPTFDENAMIQELCTFMLAGQDSVGAALVFCLYSLAKHQDVQELVIEEINSIFKDASRTPNLQDLRQMTYLEQCIKETLRLYPSVPLIARKVSQDIILGNHVIPSGCSVFMTPFVTHRIPHIYPDPEKFDPNRFSTDETMKRHPYAFIPFSAGPRNCIGFQFSIMEMKTVISTLLRNYKIDLSPGHEELKLSWRVTLRASGGVWLRFSPRNMQPT